MENQICCVCKKNESGESQNISFFYNGFKITVNKTALECFDCVKKQWIEKNKNYWRKIIESLKENKPKINWQEYKEILDKNEDNEEELNKLLLDIGVLSTSPKGNWMIMGSGMNLNPAFFGTPLFFVNESDAKEFARLEYHHTLYGWNIQHIDTVLTKEDILPKETKK
jgi:hypothetical protein